MTEIPRNKLNADFFGYLHLCEPQERKEIQNYGGEKYIEENFPVLHLSRIKKDKGVYLLFEEAKNNCVIPLYVGRTCTFLTRFQQHFYGCSSSGLLKYYQLIEDEDWPGEYPYALGFCLWIESDAEKRKNLEHKKISEIKPIFNKD